MSISYFIRSWKTGLIVLALISCHFLNSSSADNTLGSVHNNKDSTVVVAAGTVVVLDFVL